MQKKIRIALIDSGIDSEFKCQNLCGAAFFYSTESKILRREENYSDSNGHGTYCAQIIASYCKHVEFVVVKILDEDNRGSSIALVEALKYIMQFSIDLVNLSISVFDIGNRAEIKKLCLELQKRGVIINVSVTNRCLSSFPASLESTTGVRGALNIVSNEIWYNSKKEIQCVANMMPVLVGVGNQKKTFFGGNSKATAVLTGLLASELYEKQIDKTEVFYGLSVKAEWCEEDIQMNFDRELPCEPKEGVEAFAYTVCELLEVNKEQRKDVLTRLIYLPFMEMEKGKYINLIEQLADIYKKKLVMGKLELSESFSISALYSFFCGD